MKDVHWDMIASRIPTRIGNQCYNKFAKLDITWCPEEDRILMSLYKQKDIDFVITNNLLNSQMKQGHYSLYVPRTYQQTTKRSKLLKKLIQDKSFTYMENKLILDLVKEGCTFSEIETRF